MKHTHILFSPKKFKINHNPTKNHLKINNYSSRNYVFLKQEKEEIKMEKQNE